MFCDGECVNKRKNRKCGLFTELIVEEKGKEGQPITKQMCMFQAILESLIRIELHQGGLHAAMNSTRNENSKNLQEVKTTLTEAKHVIAQGFVGLIREAEKANKLDVSPNFIEIEEKLKNTGK